MIFTEYSENETQSFCKLIALRFTYNKKNIKILEYKHVNGFHVLKYILFVNPVTIIEKCQKNQKIEAMN